MSLIHIFRYSNVENFSIQTNDFPSRYRLNVKVQEFICHQIVSCFNLILVLYLHKPKHTLIETCIIITIT